MKQLWRIRHEFEDLWLVNFLGSNQWGRKADALRFEEQLDALQVIRVALKGRGTAVHA
jgi:hypothetical protein